MAILKIRDADGNIKSIAIMKGDKGEGVPNGGYAGQIVKKTAEGTEWVYPSVTPAVVFSNTDVNVKSAAITKRGLYEVDIAYAHYSGGEYTHHRHLVSIDDLSKTQQWESTVGVLHRESTTVATYDPSQYLSVLVYDNGELSSKICTRRLRASASNNVIQSDTDTGCPSFVAEVKLLLPYTDAHTHSNANGVCQICGAVNPKYEQVDAFANHQPIISSDYTTFEWSGNWTAGDLDANGNYREFNTVHADTGNTDCKWLIYTETGVDPQVGFWSTSAGYRVIPVSANRIGTATNYDMLLTWTAPEAGVVKIGATDFNITHASTSYNLRLYLNGELIYPADGYLNIGYNAINTDEAFIKALADVALTVKEDDKLQFRCTRITQGMNTAFMPTVEYVHDCVLSDTSL